MNTQKNINISPINRPTFYIYILSIFGFISLICLIWLSGNTKYSLRGGSFSSFFLTISNNSQRRCKTEDDFQVIWNSDETAIRLKENNNYPQSQLEGSLLID